VRKDSTEGKFVGLDISDKQGTFVVLGEDARVVEEGRVAMTPTGLARCFGERESLRIALETGTHSPWVSRNLAALVIGVGSFFRSSRRSPA
jgi:transposase